MNDRKRQSISEANSETQVNNGPATVFRVLAFVHGLEGQLPTIILWNLADVDVLL
jgi:hypothetical protein